MTRGKSGSADARPEVRPRLVWGGTVGAVAGMIGLGLGMVLDLTVLTIVGAVVALVALVLAWRGGIVYDVKGRSSDQEGVGSIVAGDEHRGVVPGEEIHDEAAERRAAELAEQKQADLARSRREGHSPTTPIGAYLLLVLAVWLLIGQWLLGYRYTVLGQNAALRDQGFAIVVGLCGIRLRLVRRSPVATVVSLLAGVLLVLAGALLPHSATQTAVNEVVVGGLVVLGGALTWSSRRG